MADTIRLECPECGREMDVARHRTDYPEAVRLQMRCPDCDRGDHAELVYVDAAGKHITRDPDEFLRASDQQAAVEGLRELQRESEDMGLYDQQGDVP